MQRLESYAAGTWHQGSGTARNLVNPTTGELIAECDSTGVDFGAVLQSAHEQGGPALRAMTFEARGKMLKDLAAAIHEHREELIELAIANGGNTRGDAKFDLDGATGTLAAYAHYGKSLGDRPFLSDGEGMQLGRTARFWGQHVFVPRHGVAVHINAFNFPAWGMMEKAACALLAGVPVIEKPGTPTALVAWKVARIAIDSGLLPEGSFQFIAGSLGDLLDRLGPQDSVAFTGSATTGLTIKSTPNLLRQNVRVNIEADSVNAAVLAPDVDSSADAYGEFLSNVARDMTQKTGQKCTAVRRILVPADRVEEVVQDLVAEIGRTAVGDPTDKANRMGPLTNAGQFEEVQAGVRGMMEAASVACGGPDALAAGDCFIAPTLLVANDARHPGFHDKEVFGPVATVLPYTGSAADAVELVNLGGGGLVTSVYSNDADWSTEYILGVAPWHGRVWIGSDRSAGQALPPGMVLPGMIHGGPGRAGGGEELGAERGLAFYMQRVALQGFKGLVDGSFGAKKEAAAEA
ncbi:MAG: 3,4-dehydroadipyl-CoA semialdehyde dehydrogenase [Chlamydiales bacterium]|jgi:3,4-dehydroadipyl-CoA semialdehyde dehydrogenase